MTDRTKRSFRTAKFRRSDGKRDSVGVSRDFRDPSRIFILAGWLSVSITEAEARRFAEVLLDVADDRPRAD